MDNYLIDHSEVLVIGIGGAGLSAAIEVKKVGGNVHILGKREKSDAHTVLAAGGINAAFGNVDVSDTWMSHFADTYNEGYRIGNPNLIESMVRNSAEVVTEIDNWGANFEKLSNGKIDQRFFGAHSYRRTCYVGDYTGQAILKTLLKRAKKLSIPIFDSQYVTELLVSDNTCFGALSFNINNGEKTIHYSNSVILCTGGHTRIWKKSSSRKKENTGDGIFLAAKIGCKLIDMEMVQFHPTGMTKPEDMEGILVTEAVRGEGGLLFNANGERYMSRYDNERMELSTRDKIAVANYTEIIEGRGTPSGGVYLDISHKSKGDILRKIPKIYEQFLEHQDLDISKNMMEVAPTAHYSMGGIYVNDIDHSTNIRGLYAAGEVAGGLHGANRLGGNSLAEILVFGKLAGTAAMKFSKEQKIRIRSSKIIQESINRIDERKKEGVEASESLINELREIMWSRCGVIKNQDNLIKGLEELKNISERAKDIKVRFLINNYQDLINSYDLEASIFSAKATIVSALERKESRGAHQRSDYQKENKKFNCNFFIRMGKSNELICERKEIIDLSLNQKSILYNHEIANITADKLLE